jgi:putative transposase
MCRCLRVSTSGFYAWSRRPKSRRTRDNERLLVRIRAYHEESDGVMGMPRIHEALIEEGETASRNRIARIMAKAGLRGIPQRKQWGRKQSGTRPEDVRNELERDFRATEPNTKWVTDITYISTAEGWLYLCVVVDLFSNQVVGWSMSTTQDRHLVLRAVLMACWQRSEREPVVLHSDRGTQFTSHEYQKFLKDHHITMSMSAVGHCADNAPAEGFFGMLKRERVNRRRYRTTADARADVFDYIERFHNPRIQRRIDAQKRQVSVLTHPSALAG